MNNMPIHELLIGAGVLVAICIVCLIYLMGKISQISQEKQNFNKVRIDFFNGPYIAIINGILMCSLGLISMVMIGSGAVLCAYRVIRMVII